MKSTFLCLIAVIFSALSAYSQVPDANGILYVKKGSSGTGDSWANALGELADAQYYAYNTNIATAGTVKEIWVAGGTYYPKYDASWVTTTPRLYSFRILKDVGIYGGFAGTETARTDRDLSNTANASVLSGDIGATGNSNNYACRVVVGVGGVGTAVLDGFTITKAYNNGANFLTVDNYNIFPGYGGGIYLGVSCSPVLSHLNITDNYAYYYGGGLFVYGNSSFKLSHSTISNNKVDNGGGGVYSTSLSGSSPNATISDTKIWNNKAAAWGGGLYNVSGAPDLVNVSIRGNSTGTEMGAIGNMGGSGGAMTGCEIIGNYSPGAYNYGTIFLSTNSVSITNTTIAGNNGGSAPYINFNTSSSVVNNSVMTGNANAMSYVNKPLIKNSLVQGEAADIAFKLLDPATDPMFVSPMAYSTTAFTGGDYTLAAGSPLIDGGGNGYYTGLNASTLDIKGDARVLGYSDGGIIDIGANESQVKFSQTITASDVSVNYGIGDYNPGATASSGLTVSYASADNSIAEVVDGLIRVRKAGTVTITASQSGNGLYNAAADVTFTLTITKGVLLVTPNSATKVYDGLGYSGGNGVTFIGFAYSDNADSLGGTLTFTGSSQGATDVGSYILTPSGYTSDNYYFSYTWASLKITKAPLTVTANDASKVYDGTRYYDGNGLTYSGFVNNETAAVLTGDLYYDGTSQGALDAGDYVITPGGLTAANYAITYQDGSLSVSKANLTITAVDDSKTYNGIGYAGGHGVTYTGFVNNERAAVALTGILAYNGTSQGAINKGDYIITPGGLNAANYAINYVNGVLHITPATLTVTANDDTKIYDGVGYNGGNGVSYSGFVNNETTAVLSGVVSYGGTSQGAVNAGNYNITPAGLSAVNYAITYNDGSLSVGKADLTITAVDDNKTYDGIGYAGGHGVSYAGFVNNETAAVLTGTVVYNGTSQGAINVGDYIITPSGLTSGNYAITYQDGSLSVSKANLTITAVDDSKTYDGTGYTGGHGVTYAGFVNNETSAVLTGAVVYNGTSQGAINSGDYLITPGGLNAANYAISYVDGALHIAQAALTVTANDDTKIYDGVAFNGGNGVSYSGFVNNETSAVLTGTVVYNGTSQGAINSGNYIIIPAGLFAVNYAITYVNGALSVTKAALTVTAVDDNKTYSGIGYTGGNGVTYAGFVNNETSAVLTGTVAYSGSSQGATNVNTYIITPAGLAAANYSITYADGSLSITKAALTITANDYSKVYNDDAYSGGNGVTYSGFVNNETAAVLTGNITYDGTSQGAINAGNYTITPLGMSAANYDITYADGTLSITKAALTITAANFTKVYNGLAYYGGSGLIYSGFAGTDNASALTGPVLFSGTSQGATNVGTYVLTPYGRTSQNYTISYVSGTLTISKAALTITADDDSKTYDGLAYTGGNGVTYTGFVNNETAAVLNGTISYSGTSQGAADAGTYVITPSGQTASNYSITYVDGTLAVAKAALTITANNDSKTYDGISYASGNGVTYSGFVNGESAAALAGTITYNGTSQGAINAGSYTITPAGQTSANYTIAYNDGTLEISKALLTITADNASRCYNTADPVFTYSYSGFVNNENGSVLSTAPVVTTNVTAGSAAGDYVLMPSGAASDNYSFSYVVGIYTIYELPVTTITTPDGTVLCGENSSVSLTVNGTNTYQWSTGQSGNSILVTNTGDYSLTATDTNGCSAPAENTVNITASALPIPGFTYDYYCAGKPVTFTNTTTGGTDYSWNTSDGQTSTAVSPDITFSQGGNYTITLTATVAACPNNPVAVAKDVKIEDEVANVRLNDVTTAPGVPVQLNGRVLSGAAYQWSPETALSASDISNPVATLTASQRYYINMSFASGCSTTDTLVVNVSDSKFFAVANAFTPNNDGMNDVLHVGLRGIATLEFFEIYDRWGGRVFRSTSVGTGWDGTLVGQHCAAGGYIWVAQGRDYTGQLVKNSGTVILIR